MSDRALRWLSRLIVAGCLLLVAGFAAVDVARGTPLDDLVRGYALYTYVLAVCFPAVGALIVSRYPRHRLGWVYLLLGAGMTSALTHGYAEWALTEAASTPPLAVFASWVGGWAWFPSIGAFLTFALLLFPDGHLPSRRWRPVAWVAAGGICLVTVDFARGAWRLRGARILGAGDGELASGLPTVLAELGMVLVLLAALASAASLVVRLRRSHGERRQQLKWVVYAGAVTVLVQTGTILTTPAGEEAGSLVLVLIAPLIPLATALAIVRYRLYDIDLLINRTVLVGLLGGFITAVYVAIVVGLGALVGRGLDDPDVTLSLLATALVAAAFQPARQRAQRLANRLVYGQRATPYEVLADFTSRIAGSVSTEQIVPRMAETAGHGVGAQRVTIAVALPGGGERRFTWPGNADDRSDADRVIPVVHHGEEVGRIAVWFGDRAAPTEQDLSLLQDLADQAGVALRTVRLDAELQARGDEVAEQARQVRASRQRLVVAQDDERRRMERDIHDGAQQQLVAMSVKIGLAAQLLDRDPDRAVAILEQLGQDANEALEGLRDLARGIFPPLLVEQGIVAALDAHVRKHALPVTILTDPGAVAGRFGQDVEVAVYFCCLEAIQNAAKHAPGAPVTVRLSLQDGALRFSVADEGPGFDPTVTPRGSGLQNMADRIAALGGQLTVDGAAGVGVAVAGCIPLGTPATPAPTPAA